MRVALLALALAAWLLAGPASGGETAEAPYMQGMDRQVAWMEACAGRPVALATGDLHIFSVDVAGLDADAVVACLTAADPAAAEPEVVLAAPGVRAVVFRTPFYTLSIMEPPSEHPAPAVLVQSGGKVHIVQTYGALAGLLALEHVRDDIFVLTTGHITHDRNYLLRGGDGVASHIRDGRLEVVDSDALLFRTHGSKSYWDGGGAFWYDAIVDRDGKIIDFVTDPDYPKWRCFGLAEFAARTGLDVSRVSTSEVCVRGALRFVY